MFSWIQILQTSNHHMHTYIIHSRWVTLLVNSFEHEQLPTLGFAIDRTASPNGWMRIMQYKYMKKKL